MKSQLTEEDPRCWERLRVKEKRAAKDEMVRKHHQLNGHELEQTPEIMEDREGWHATVHGSQRVGQDLATEQQPSFDVPTTWSLRPKLLHSPAPLPACSEESLRAI